MIEARMFTTPPALFQEPASLQQHALLTPAFGDLSIILDSLTSTLPNIVTSLDITGQVASPASCPFSKLPPEIIRLIFIFCHKTEDEFVVNNVRQSPLNISSVCGLWRDIALATPELWCSLRPQMSSWRESYEPASKTLNAWFERSQRQPFQLSLPLERVDRSASSSPTSSSGLWEFLSRLPDLPRQLNAFDMSIQAEEVQSTLHRASFLQCDAPLLEKLSITIHNNAVPVPRGVAPTHEIAYLPVSLFRSKPRLQNFSLRINQHIDSFTFNVPWSQLTSLTLARLDEHIPLPWHHDLTLHNHTMLQILQQCPLLTHCSIFIHATSIPLLHSTQAQPVHLPHLRSLRIYIDSMDYYKYVITVDPLVFRVLRLSVLESLEIVCPAGYLRGIFWPNAEFLSLLGRSKETLKKLVLDRLPLDEDEIMDTIKGCRVTAGLEELALRRMRVGGRALSLLTPSLVQREGSNRGLKGVKEDTGKVLLPSLKVLRLTDEKTHLFRHGADRAFADLLLDRMGVSEPAVKVIWEEEL